MTNLAILISGNGSNLQAVIDAIKYRVLDAKITLVVSNRAEAHGLRRARNANIPTVIHLLKPYVDDGRGREAYDADLADLVKERAPDFVVLAGWMHVLSLTFLRHFPYRVINLHPALPGQFPGANAIAKSYEAFQRGEIKETGVMVHLVPDEKVDAGPVLGTQRVAIYASDTLESLEKRIHQAEHTLLIRALDRLIHGDSE